MLFFIAGLLLSVWGIVMTILERRLIFTRKAVTGINGLTVTVMGGIFGAGGLWVLTEKYYAPIVYAVVLLVVYIIICCAVKKKEYPEDERFTKES
jgi:phosphotransferase system  glucose/maltose/N-acetylglucosamine-specific IIC component